MNSEIVARSDDELPHLDDYLVQFAREHGLSLAVVWCFDHEGGHAGFWVATHALPRIGEAIYPQDGRKAIVDNVGYDTTAVRNEAGEVAGYILRPSVIAHLVDGS